MADGLTAEQHELLERARERLANMSPEQREAILRAQTRRDRASGSGGSAFLRGGATGLTNLAASIPGLPISTATAIGEYAQNNPHISAAIPGAGLFAGFSNVIPRNEQGAPVGGSTDLASRARGWVNESDLGSQAPPTAVQAMIEQLGLPPRPSDAPQRPTLTYESIDDLPPEERPYAVAGETLFPNLLAGGALISGARGLAGSQTMRNAPGWAQGLVNSISSNPVTARTALGLESVGAGTGAGIAESTDPGNYTRRLAYELIGGIGAPMSPVLKAGNWLGNQGRRFASGLNQNAADGRAVDLIRRSFNEAGEDANALIPMLEDATGANAVLTSGHRTASPTLLAIEAKIARENPGFGVRTTRNAERSLEDLRGTIDEFVASGDPEDLRRAAVLRRNYFDRVVRGQLDDAQRRVDEVMEALGSNPSAQARREASQEAAQIMDQALRQARRVESQLWDEGIALLPDTPMPATGLSDRYRAVRSEMRDSVSLPDNLDADLRNLIDDEGAGGMMSPQQLRIMRSDLLDAAREARGAGRTKLAGRLDQLADAALDDLMEIGGEVLADARAYSTRLNDQFTRNFGGRATSVDVTGSARVQPDTMLDTTFSGRNAATNAEQLQEGAEFGGNAVGRMDDTTPIRTRSGEVPVDPNLGPRMAQAQEDFLRSAAGQVMDMNGTVNPQRLARFMRDNELALQRFPQLREQLADVESAARAFDRAGVNAAQARQALEQTAFSRAAGFENGTDGVDSVLRGQNPVRGYRQLVATARRAGEDAVAGLRSATLDALRRRATGPDGSFSFSRFREALMSPQAQGQPTVLQMMERDGVIDAAMADRMRTALQQADRIEVAMSAPGRAADLIENPSAFADFILRVKGAAIGGDVFRIAGGSGPGGLVAAGAGSQAVRAVMNKIPNASTMSALQRMMEQPQLLATMLRNTDSMTPAEAVRHARALEALLTRAGLITARSATVEQHSDGEMQLDNGG